VTALSEKALLARTRFDRGYGDSREAISLLGEAFPSLARIQPPGLRPWDPSLFQRWLRNAAVSPGERDAALFVWSVWSGNEPVARGLRFDAMEAIARWDDEHRAVFRAWAAAPWWP
jgi:hypothetical protein